MKSENHDDRMILLTGATGYVGGRLLRVLEHEAVLVRSWLHVVSVLEKH
jgi:nucleoside-diphosphate-sugar epimerase